MGFSEEMLNMGNTLRTAFEDRRRQVRNNIQGTHRFLNDQHNKQMQRAREQRNFLSKFANGLSKYTQDLSKNTQNTLSCFRRNHQETAKRQCHLLRSFTRHNATTVGNLLERSRMKRHELRNAFDRAHNNFMKVTRDLTRLRSSGILGTGPRLHSKGTDETPRHTKKNHTAKAKTTKRGNRRK